MAMSTTDRRAGLQRRAIGQEIGEAGQPALGEPIDLRLACHDIGEMRLVEPLQDPVVTGFCILRQHRRRVENQSRCHERQNGGRSPCHAQPCKGAAHEQHDEAVDQKQDHGEREEGRLERHGLGTDQGFAGIGGLKPGLVDRLELGIAGQKIERRKAVLRAIETRRVFEPS